MIRLLLLFIGILAAITAGILFEGKIGYIDLLPAFQGLESWYYLLGLALSAVILFVLAISEHKWLR